MRDPDLCWRAEEACAAAWPAMREVMLGGWLVRAAGGPTRRLNSVNPVRGSSYDPRPVMEEVEHLYRRLGRSPIYRVPTIAPGMDEALSSLGFIADAETTTVLADLRLRSTAHDDGVHLAECASPAWLNFRNQVSNATPEAAQSYAETIDSIILPTRFATICENGAVVSAAYGALFRGLLVIESVATAPYARRRGFGRLIVGALMDWARGEGVQQACLQVMSDNHPARALYDGLGFGRELYRYHYRSPPAAV